MAIAKKVFAPVVALAVIGAAGLGLIKESEGLKYKAYRDSVGIPTICYGHTGPDVKMGMVATQKQCDAWLASDIEEHASVIIPGNKRNCVANVKLNQNQHDAVVSFTFNIGTTKFCKSTMARKLKAGDTATAGRELPRWVYAGPHKLKGLVIRRDKEMHLYYSPTAVAAPVGNSAQVLTRQKVVQDFVRDVE